MIPAIMNERLHLISHSHRGPRIDFGVDILTWETLDI